jgi:hypothetical protein
MYVSIRRYEYEGASMTTDEFVRLGREIVAGISPTQGFVSFLILSSTPESQGLNRQRKQVVATVSIFEDPTGLEQADRLVATPLDERVAAQCPQLVEITSGEVVFQRGL